MFPWIRMTSPPKLLHHLIGYWKIYHPSKFELKMLLCSKVMTINVLKFQQNSSSLVPSGSTGFPYFPLNLFDENCQMAAPNMRYSKIHNSGFLWSILPIQTPKFFKNWDLSNRHTFIPLQAFSKFTLTSLSMDKLNTVNLVFIELMKWHESILHVFGELI